MQIFSLFMQLFMGHIVSSLHLLKEKIFFFMCILNLIFFFFFKFVLCVFIFPTSKIFPKTIFPKTCFVFPIFIGGEAYFYPLFFIGGVVSISYRVELFCVPFFLYFLLLCYVCFLSIF